MCAPVHWPRSRPQKPAMLPALWQTLPPLCRLRQGVWRASRIVVRPHESFLSSLSIDRTNHEGEHPLSHGQTVDNVCNTFSTTPAETACSTVDRLHTFATLCPNQHTTPSNTSPSFALTFAVYDTNDYTSWMAQPVRGITWHSRYHELHEEEHGQGRHLPSSQGGRSLHFYSVARLHPPGTRLGEDPPQGAGCGR